MAIYLTLVFGIVGAFMLVDDDDNYLAQIVTWSEVQQEVTEANKVLANLIDQIDPNDEYKFVKVSYPFGLDIVRLGQFQLPVSNNRAVSLHDECIPSTLQELLGKLKVPVGLLLNNAAEVYYETEKRIIPDKVWNKGELVGVWELLDHGIERDTTQLSNLSSGARSIFMLPKISDRISHNRIKRELNIHTSPPNHLSEHRDLFADIACQTDEGRSWRCDLLFFTDKWYETNNSKPWTEFTRYLAEVAWKQSYNCRLQFELNIAWEKAVQMINRKNIYVQPALANHIKHLYAISENIFPAMRFSTNCDNHLGPLNLIQDTYANIYQLKEYMPLLMCPAHINHIQPLYYSLNFPTYFEPCLETKAESRIINDLRLIKQVIEIINDKIGIGSGAIFDYFHAAKDKYNVIKNSNDIPRHDEKLAAYIQNHADTYFPNNSPFLKGCISIETV